MPVPAALLRRGAPADPLSTPLILIRPPTTPISALPDHVIISKSLLCAGSTAISEYLRNKNKSTPNEAANFSSASPVSKQSSNGILASIMKRFIYSSSPPKSTTAHNTIETLILPHTFTGPDSDDLTWPLFLLFISFLRNSRLNFRYGETRYGHHILWSFAALYGSPIWANAILHDLSHQIELSTSNTFMDTIPARDLRWLYDNSSNDLKRRKIRVLRDRERVFGDISPFWVFLCEWILKEREGRGRGYWREVLFWGGEVAVLLGEWSGFGEGEGGPGCVRCYEVDEGLETSTSMLQGGVSYTMDVDVMKEEQVGRSSALRGGKSFESNHHHHQTSSFLTLQDERNDDNLVLSAAAAAGTKQQNDNPTTKFFVDDRQSSDKLLHLDPDADITTSLDSLSLTTSPEPEEIPDIDAVLARLKLEDEELAANGYQNIEHGDARILEQDEDCVFVMTSEGERESHSERGWKRRLWL